ncbi:F0F1 ATP synthase subunit delta [Acidaminobacter sp. JC074]|uniref:F0F1 ATP synthase subunit delta n=1 Tax=Acidaminobacter sp. JC074 TaxID=2530199 RepID=UPI001F0DC5AF|nr:F0F1 ATP synthase subunit delta [Acidaminobacter sp. JC074]MCH4889336.1 F0F1 ATP synthase subunit delta [Acidaminobacter sp. JC074]
MAKLVSKTYAKALFELAVEGQMVDQILAEYEFVKDSFDEFPEFLEIVKSPKIAVEDKKNILVETFGEKVSETLINFFKILVDKKRSDVIREVYDDLSVLVDEEKGLVVARVESVIPLEANEIEALEAKLSNVTGKTVTIDNVINPDIMGGLVVKVGDQVLDGSVKHKLDNLKHELAEIII